MQTFFFYLWIRQLWFERWKVFVGFDVLALCLSQKAVYVFKLRLDRKKKKKVHLNESFWQPETFHRPTAHPPVIPHKRHCTCILVNFSANSCLCRSLSPYLTCSSWTWLSAFLRRCSESPFPCVRVFNSICNSLYSLSRACFAFSTDTLFCRNKEQRIAVSVRFLVSTDDFIFWPQHLLPFWPVPAVHWALQMPDCVFVSCQTFAARGPWPHHREPFSGGLLPSHVWPWRHTSGDVTKRNNRTWKIIKLNIDLLNLHPPPINFLIVEQLFLLQESPVTNPVVQYTQWQIQISPIHFFIWSFSMSVLFFLAHLLRSLHRLDVVIEDHLSSCCAAVVSKVSSSSVLRASSSSPRSLRCFSALERACLSSSRSSCSSEIWASSSRIFFWAEFLAAASSSILGMR